MVEVSHLSNVVDLSNLFHVSDLSNLSDLFDIPDLAANSKQQVKTIMQPTKGRPKKNTVLQYYSVAVLGKRGGMRVSD